MHPLRRINSDYDFIRQGTLLVLVGLQLPPEVLSTAVSPMVH